MTVLAEKVGARVWVTSDQRIRDLGRDVPGASFSTHNGPHWSVPLELESCRRLRGRFGKQLEIGPALWTWAKLQREREDQLTQLGKQSDADLQRVPKLYPRLAAAMVDRTYQRVGARFAAEGKSVLIADQPGLGKTLEALAGVVESGVPGPYLVVCPKTAVQAVWAQEIPRWLPGQSVIAVPDGRAARDKILDVLANRARVPAALDRTWVVIHPEMVRTKSSWVCSAPEVDVEGNRDICGLKTPCWAGPKELGCGHDPKRAPRVDEHEFPQLFAVEWGAIIADESDKMLLRRTGHSTQTRTGAELLQSRPDGLRIAMSGTPMRGRPTLLWGTLNWLRPQEFKSVTRFVDQHFQVKSGYNGSRVIGPLSEEGQEALYRTMGGIVLRRTKEEVASDLPEKQWVGTYLDPNDETSVKGVWLPMTGRQKALHDKMAKDSSVRLDGGTLDAIGTLAQRTRLKQFATSAGQMYGDGFEPAFPSNKYDYMLQLMAELGIPIEGPKSDAWDPSTKLVVVSQFTQLLNLFAGLIDNRVMLTGQVTGARRAQAIDRFNEEPGTNSPHIMFLNTKAGGVAITLDTADHMIILDETEVPDDQEQVEDRIHRVSRPRPVFYHYLRSLGSIEESIAQVGADRKATVREVLDSRRGL